MKRVYFITHPDVVIDPNIPVPKWPLSEKGVRRMNAFLEQTFISNIDSIYCSAEQKAIDSAGIIADHLSLDTQRFEALGENDRSSTGFLPSDEFEKTADQFFANPDISVRGWETALNAQTRIVRAVDRVIAKDTPPGDIAIVSHGGVGALLLCQLAGYPISREHDQPAGKGGNFFTFTAGTRELIHGWKPIEPDHAGRESM